jgi:protein-S-isoprenylcysteine O-methyltransferase Ste14
MTRRILPPVLFLALAILSVAAGLLLPIARWIAFPSSLIGVLPLVGGLAVAAAQNRRFARVGTNIMTFDDPDVLVSTGWFARSRNPMYLGFLVGLLGIALVVGTLTAMVGPVLFFLAADRWYIPFEEGRMLVVFGSAYEAYKGKVRRWL